MPDLDFTGKVFAITGAASGIGLAIAAHLSSHGATLTLADIQADAMAAVVDKLEVQFPSTPGSIMSRAISVLDSKAVDEWMASSVEALGPMDGAANMAGMASTKSYPGGFADVSDEDWARMIGVNLTGMFYSIRAQIQPGRLKDGGSIILAGSAMSKLPGQQDGGYAAAKHGVLGLARTLAKDLGSRGIRVNCICPGTIETPMLRDALQRLGLQSLPGSAIPRIADAAEVADLVGFLLSDRSRFISGTDLSIDGAWAY